MARLEDLDFNAYVEKRREAARFSGEKDDPGSHAYAFLSDRTTRRTFDRIKPVELAVAATVRSYKQFGKNQMLGHAVKVGPRQFPRVHQIAQDCAETPGSRCRPSTS